MIEVMRWGGKKKKHARQLNKMRKYAFVPALSHVTPS